MTEDVLNWIKKEKLMTEGDTVIVGLSGGADSVALLLVLLELRQRIGYTLLAIHVEHGIRGEEKGCSVCGGTLQAEKYPMQDMSGQCAGLCSHRGNRC